MNYPSISDYIDALRSASDNLSELKYLELVQDAQGNPMMSSGNFAVVFKMRDSRSGSLHALKCFTREQEGRQESYRMITQELEFISSRYLTPIRYLSRELFVDVTGGDAEEFPVLLMDWLEGTPLDKYIEAHLDDRWAMERIGYQFSLLAQWLLSQSFAHGDLKPDNILVLEDATLALVDYDGIYVPAMQGMPMREQGTPGYRHPERTTQPYDEHIDDYSLALLALSLRAITLEPQLYREYGTKDSLLFTEAELSNLTKARAWGRLQGHLGDPTFTQYLGLFLIAQSQGRLHQLSFRLFAQPRPIEPPQPAPVLLLSTKVTDEDWANSWVDEYGFRYSQDGTKLIEGSREIIECTIRVGTQVICDEAFAECSALTSINLPNSLTQIGDSAFSLCFNLTSINLPNSLTQIGNGAFAECSALTSINLPNSLTQIGNSAFLACSALTSINLPNSLTQIGNGAFVGCSALTSINLPNSLTQIGDSAFSLCFNLTSINLPNRLTQIGNGAFAKCSALTSITLPNSLTQIGNEAFSWCSALKSITCESPHFYVKGMKIYERATDRAINLKVLTIK